MNKSQRIYMDVNEDVFDKHIKVKLEQNTDTLEFLSMSIDTNEIYRNFNADYGVLVGRVTANNSVGIPNAKISIFIPIDEEDKNNSFIRSIYPYESPRDKNNDGKRYNLLPRVSRVNRDGLIKPTQPFGSFPTKEEILTNENYLTVYKKYYKFTTVTNNNGDYMLFGVPTGTQTAHMSVDITDIGEFSMSPASMVVNLGYSPNLFSNNNTEIKPSNDLTDLPHIETQEISVDVIPFWGDVENYQIGITRQDFRIRAEIKSNSVLFGTIGTMGETSVIGTPDRDTRGDNAFYLISKKVEQNYDIRTLRGSDNLNIRLFTYPNYIKQQDIDDDLTTNFTSLADYNNNRKINPLTDIIEVDKSEYFAHVENGTFVIVVPCNRDKVVIDETGNIINVPDDNENGIYTKFLGMLLIDYENDNDLPINLVHNDTYFGKDKAYNDRGKMKIPQGDFNLMPEVENNNYEDPDMNYFENHMSSEKWRKKYFILEYNSYHSISQFFPTVYNAKNKKKVVLPTNTLVDNNNIDEYLIGGFIFKTSGIDYMGGDDNLNLNGYEYIYDINNQTTINDTTIPGVTSDTNSFTIYEYEFPHNKVGVQRTFIDSEGKTKNVNEKYFGAQWINMFAVLPQFSYARDYTTYDYKRYEQVATMIFGNNEYDYKNSWYLRYKNNNQHVFSNVFGSTNIIRADSFKTDVIKIPKQHLTFFNTIESKSINLSDYSGDITDTTYYKYQLPNNVETDLTYQVAYDNYNKGPYLFKGFYNNDCIKTLNELNLLQ